MNVYALIGSRLAAWAGYILGPGLIVAIIVAVFWSGDDLRALAEAERQQALIGGYLGSWRAWDAAVSFTGPGPDLWAYYATVVFYRLFVSFPVLLPVLCIAVVCTYLAMIRRRQGMARFQHGDQPSVFRATMAVHLANLAIGGIGVVATLPLNLYAPLTMPLALCAIPIASYYFHRDTPIEYPF